MPEPIPLADAAWELALDDFARFLTDHYAVAAEVQPVTAIAEFRWPAHLGPMPPRLIPRATHLAAEAAQLVERHRARLAAMAGRRRLLSLAPIVAQSGSLNVSG